MNSGNTLLRGRLDDLLDFEKRPSASGDVDALCQSLSQVWHIENKGLSGERRTDHSQSEVLAGIENVNSPTVNDEIHAPMGGVRDSGWGRTGPRSLDDFSDVIWINSHGGQRQYPPVSVLIVRQLTQ